MEKKNRLYFIKHIIFIFIFILIISLLIPYGGDDWNNYLYKNASIVDIIKIARGFYLSYEGRFFSRIFLAILVPRQILWAFINAIFMSSLYTMIVKILKVDNNKFFINLSLIFILLVDMQTYAQVYVWKTGNITYLLPMVYAFFLIYIRCDFVEKKVRLIDYLLVPITFMFSMFVENVSVGIVTICFLNLIYFYKKNNRIDKLMLSCLIVSIIGLLLMVFSPGNFIRLSAEKEFYKLSIFGKFMYNIPNLITYTFIKNSFLLLLMLIVMLVIINKKIKNKIYKTAMFLYIAVVPVLTLVANIFSYSRLLLPKIFRILLDTSRWYICVYWIIFAIIFVILCFINYNRKNKKWLYFLIVGVVSNGSMMISPTWGGRTACLTTFMLGLLSIYTLVSFDLNIYNNKITIKLLSLISIIFIILFSIYSFYIYKLNLYRNKYINYQLNNDYEEIDIIILPEYWMWNLNTWGSDGVFAEKFKLSYGININAKLHYVKRNEVKIDLQKLNESTKIQKN